MDFRLKAEDVAKGVNEVHNRRLPVEIPNNRPLPPYLARVPGHLTRCRSVNRGISGLGMGSVKPEWGADPAIERMKALVWEKAGRAAGCGSTIRFLANALRWKE